MMTFRSVRTVILALCLGIAVPTVSYGQQEPSVELARTWWEDETNVWTPIGWKNNYLRYAVLYNGAVMIDPAHGLMGPRPHSKQFVGKDFMLTFHTLESGVPAALPSGKVNVRSIDYGHGIQGWDNSHETPLLWTEHRCQSGLVIREEVFAHQVGAGDVRTGLEPLYAWVRLKVVWVDPMRRPDNYPVCIQLSRVYYEHDGECYDPRSSEPSFKIMLVPDKAPYEKPLEGVEYSDNGLKGLLVTEPDGCVRVGVLPTEDGRLDLSTVSEGVYSIRATLKSEVGDYVDLLLPMMPQTRADYLAEAALTYDGALTQSDWYWAQRPSTAARMDVPEQYITEAVSRSLKFAPVIAELDHETLQYSYLTGAWGYDCLWATPTSTVSHMLADQMGYHDLTARYSEIFLQNQGSIKAPGSAYRMHPGYFGSPKTLTSIDWLTDHGAVLLQLATCCLLSHDKQITEHFLPAIIKACDFIKDMSSVKEGDGVKGLLPPAVSSDDGIETQAVFNIAWNYKGLCAAVRLLETIGHPRAAEFAALAADAKRIFVEEYHKVAEAGPRWTDSQGRERYLPPSTLSNRTMPFHVFSEAFYLDTGPMVLVWAGLMDADDPVMEDVVEYFRNGPNRRYYTPVYNCIWRPSLQHEISTCEPCYSWNIFHSWQKGDRQHYLEGMYSLFVGALSQNTYISCEHRHGIQGNLFVAPLAVNLAKKSVIDDEIEHGALHLLRLCPLAWASSSRDAVFENMPTAYGPVDLRFRLSEDGRELDIHFASRFVDGLSPRVVLHPLPLDGLEHLVVNGKRYENKNEIIL